MLVGGTFSCDRWSFLHFEKKSMSDLAGFQVFDSSGSFLSYVNTSADPLYGPQGLAINDQGHVVVADSGNHCIKIYHYLQ